MVNNYNWNLDPDYISHHGILGMKWNQRNGPPYPLESTDHSIYEKRAADAAGINVGKNSGKGSIDKVKNFKLSSTQKKILIGTGVTLASAIALYGGYKLSKNFAGQINLNNILNKYGDIEVNLQDTVKKNVSSAIHNLQADTLSNAGFNILDHEESISERVNNTNPFLNKNGSRNIEGKNNCSLTSVFGFLRGKGIDVQAGSTNGQPQILGGIIEECFKVPRDSNGNVTKHIIEGHIKSFTESKESAEKLIVSRFGPNAEGVCAANIGAQGAGHAFSWKTINGKTQFFDCQIGKENVDYWNDMIHNINKDSNVIIARLDDLTPNIEGIKKYMYNK